MSIRYHFHTFILKKSKLMFLRNNLRTKNIFNRHTDNYHSKNSTSKRNYFKRFLIVTFVLHLPKPSSKHTYVYICLTDKNHFSLFFSSHNQVSRVVDSSRKKMNMHTHTSDKYFSLWMNHSQSTFHLQVAIIFSKRFP